MSFESFRYRLPPQHIFPHRLFHFYTELTHESGLDGPVPKTQTSLSEKLTGPKKIIFLELVLKNIFLWGLVLENSNFLGTGPGERSYFEDWYWIIMLFYICF